MSIIPTTLEFATPAHSNPDSTNKKVVVTSSFIKHSHSLSESAFLQDLELYLKDEPFDILPKTDYTYVRSGSYNSLYLNDSYITPNMSRYRLRPGMISTPNPYPPSRHSVDSAYTERSYSHSENTNQDQQIRGWSGSYQDHQEGLRQDDTADSGLQQTSLSYSTKRTVHRDFVEEMDDSDTQLSSHEQWVNEQNLHRIPEADRAVMILRSGTRVKNVGSRIRAIEKSSQESQSARSGSTISRVTSESMESSSKYSPEPRQTNSRYYSESRDVHSNSFTLQGESPMPGTSYQQYSQSSSGVNTSLHDVRKSLTEEFDELSTEKGVREMETEKSQRFGNGSLSKSSTSTNINHLYGLDSEEEYSDYESSQVHHARHSYQASRKSKRSHDNSSAFEVFKRSMVTIVSIVTHVIGSFSKGISSIGAALWFLVSFPFASGTESHTRGRWQVFQSIISRFILLDVWLLKSNRDRRKFCCACLPFLLAFLLLGLTAYSGWWAMSSLGTSIYPFIMTREKTTTASQLPVFGTADLSNEVQQIIIQLQQSQGSHLSRGDVELLVHEIVGREVSAGLASVKEQHDQDSMHQTKDRGEYTAKLGILQAQLETIITTLERERKASKVRLIPLAETLAKQEKLIAGLQLEILGMKNCCKNDSFYMAGMEAKINEALLLMMSGQQDSSPFSGFTGWLQNSFVSQDELNKRLEDLGQDITANIVSFIKDQKTTSQETNVFFTSNTSGLTEQYVRLMVDKALLKYSADKTGMADYALESAGGSVINIRCTESYSSNGARVSIFGIPLYYTSNSPRSVIQPEVSPGQCWAFRGSLGYLVIQLATVIVPSGFSVEHIPKSLSPTGDIDSAPQNFTVIGLANEEDTVGVSLGNYTFSIEGEPIQYFPVQVLEANPFQFIELRILSNHGHLKYTCLYRFRVHGSLYKPASA